jgi:hypothetical protein
MVTLGPDYLSPVVYQADWAAAQLDPAVGSPTWIAELDGRIMSSVNLLSHTLNNPNPIFNLGRHLNRPESFVDGSAEALLRMICDLAVQHGQWTVGRIQAADNALQILFEKLGFFCVGYQPSKHTLPQPGGTLFYVRPGQPEIQARLPISESLPQVSELAHHVLQSLGVTPPQFVRDGATGYPLKSNLHVHEASFEDFELWRQQAQSSNPPIEVSTGYNLGWGFLRLPPEAPPRILLGQREDRVVAGLAYSYDATDHCLRIIDSYATDDLSTGAVLLEAIRLSLDKSPSRYLEMDVLMTSPRLLKTAEQLGFIPVAYLPAFYVRQNRCEDVVKVVKLNEAYTAETAPLTTQARRLADIIDNNFQDLKVGISVINLLRSLPIFEGLGDGELRKIARLFEQKLFRQGELVFRQGDSGTEAYIVLRGEVDIFLNTLTQPAATLGAGQIFGELAFLDGSPRTASATTKQATILLVVKRDAFQQLAQREPHLGMVIMRNVALDLSNKLRHANLAVKNPPKP